MDFWLVTPWALNESICGIKQGINGNENEKVAKAIYKTAIDNSRYHKFS